MNTNPSWIAILSLVLIVVALIGVFGVWSVASNANKKVDSIQVPTAAQIASQITVPQAPVVNVPTAQEIADAINIPASDTAKVNKLCELTEGCEFWEGGTYELYALNSEEASDDFVRKLSNVIGLDEDEFTLNGKLAEWIIDYSGKTYVTNAVDYKDSQIRAYSEKDKDEDNWELKIFLRVEYKDVDSVDTEVVYVVVTSVLDEGNYDSLTLEEVSRNFEFE
jgi:hypothetical protein